MLTFAHLDKQLLANYETRKFITVFTKLYLTILCKIKSICILILDLEIFTGGEYFGVEEHFWKTLISWRN
jgi:hypothetical protein